MEAFRPASPGENRQGKVFTFYSFKGGVGRSMAAANVAEWCRLRGLRVVMVDWDLEAPGLETFFFPADADGEQKPSALEGIRSQLGLIDMLDSYRRQFPALLWPADADRIGRVEFLRKTLPSAASILQPIDAPAQNGGARLWLLPAGWRPSAEFAAYAQLVQSFDWATFFSSCHGEAYFDWLRDELTRFADVVIIDSRTGVTEMGGVCARWLADVVVAFCAPNEQNLDGTDTMVASFLREDLKAERGRAVEVVVVPTRLDNSETDLQNEFRRKFERRFDKWLRVSALRQPLEASPRTSNTFWDLKIPYIAKYAYREKLTVGTDDKNEDLEQAYRKLAANLALLAPEGGAMRRELATEIERFFPTWQSKVFVSYAYADREKVARLTRQLAEAGISVGLSVEAWQAPELSNEERATARVSETLDQVSALVLVLGPDTLDRPWVRWELRRAQEKGIGIFPVLLGPGRPDLSQLPPVLRTRQICHLEPNGPDTVAALAAAIRQAIPVRRVPFLAPPPPVHIVARAQYGDLKAAVLRRDRETIVLTGAGGAGKTVLAQELCADEEVIAAFPDGICWFDCAGSNIAVELAKVYEALTGEDVSDCTVPELSLRLEKELKNRRCLLVLDDVPTQKVMDAYLLGGPRCVHMVTSRQAMYRHSAAVISLSEFTAADALTMLRDRARLGPGFESDLGRLAEQVGHNPLALVMIASLIRQRIDAGEPPRDAILSTGLLIDRQGITALDVPDADSSVQRLSQRIALSIEPLTADERECLYQLAEFPAGQPIPLEAACASWRQADLKDAERFALRLEQLSLVRYAPTTRELTLHPLLRNYIVGQRLAPKRPTPAPTTVAEPSRDPKAREDGADAQEARKIFGGQRADTAALRALAKRLRNARQYSYSRRLLAIAREQLLADVDPDLRRSLAHEHSLATYKDLDLPTETRYQQALNILQSVEDLTTTSDQETLGQAGAIYKRWWEFDHQKDRLEIAAGYYWRGYEAGLTGDADFDGFSYTAINAAFVFDLLAGLETGAGQHAGLTAPRTAQRHREEAQRIRSRILREYENLPEKPTGWWTAVTLAEANFGLRRYEQAEYWLKEAADMTVADWERQTTARQLTALARLLEENTPDPADPAGSTPTQRVGELLRIFLGNDSAAVQSAFTGKVGLALSGGGFRASLFHIGVFARLAELDLLRRVEVLSCVSGGSIIGAYYYLELRHLLAAKPDAEITREDYIQIVRRLQQNFLAGVQQNIRTRVATYWPATLRMLFQPHYTRTVRLGELYESILFSRVQDGHDQAEPRYLKNLYISPHGSVPNFRPRLDNWRRAAKVPELILNSTTLNTGHVWQFTASWMGEPPGLIDSEIDGNDSLRRLYHWQAPKDSPAISLGLAVAASSCVPGLFEPVELAGLYPERTVRLVDGGVHDNQGISSLIEQECDILLVSDASGQSSSLSDPSTGPLKVSIRVNDLLMARVRETQHNEIRARRRALLLRGFMFVHLKKDLTVDPVDWNGCEDPQELFTPSASTRQADSELTSYGIPKTVQEQLAAIRTDLDSFSDQEAFALMTSGYRMAEKDLSQLGRDIPDILKDDSLREKWHFLDIERIMHGTSSRPEARTQFLAILGTGRYLAFKIWRLAPATVWPLLLVLLLPVYLVLRTAPNFGHSGWSAFLSNPVTVVLMLLMVTAMLGACANVLYRLRGKKGKPASELLLAAFLVVVGWGFAHIHLAFFDQLFLRLGNLPRPGKKSAGGETEATKHL